MKRKLLKIFAAILAAVLLFPVRLDLKDGGSVSYKSLVYEVTKLHRYDPEADGVKPYADGLQIKILGMTIFRLGQSIKKAVIKSQPFSFANI